MTSTFTPSAAHAAMTCPKCLGEMRAYERSGVIVDQCRECRGVFLDRGELEHLVSLEADAGDRPVPRRGALDDRDRLPDARPDPYRHDRARSDDRARRTDGQGEDVEAFGDMGDVAGLGDLGELLGSRDRSRSARSPEGASSNPPRKRSSFFRDLLEGLGE